MRIEILCDMDQARLDIIGGGSQDFIYIEKLKSISLKNMEIYSHELKNTHRPGHKTIIFQFNGNTMPKKSEENLERICGKYNLSKHIKSSHVLDNPFLRDVYEIELPTTTDITISSPEVAEYEYQETA
jgi:hypothetical protein